MRLAKEGAAVVVADIADGAETLALIEAAGGVGCALRCDQIVPEQVERLRDEASRRFGPAGILVHCAGIYPTQPFEEIGFADWRKVMSVNLDSIFHLTQAFLPHMTASGRIVCIASTTFRPSSPLAERPSRCSHATRPNRHRRRR